MSQTEQDESTWSARLEYSMALFMAVKQLSGPELEIACAKARENFVDQVGAETVASLEATYCHSTAPT